jgi:hypothetical protein
MSIRSAASCGQPLHDRVVPRGARTTGTAVRMNLSRLDPALNARIATSHTHCIEEVIKKLRKPTL